MPYLDHTLDVGRGALLGSPNRLKLAVFCANVQRGTTHSNAEGTLKITWDDVSRVARAVDASGIEALIPLAQWKKIDFDGAEKDRVLEPFTWAAAVAAITARVQVFSTCHVPLYHPVTTAKLAATIDLISGGRFGLNVVAGWNSHDFAMFAHEQKQHDDRYQVAAEWMQYLERIWTCDEPFDFQGAHYQGKGIVSVPKPVQTPRPVIMSAGFSPAGAAFAQRWADLNFIAVQDVTQISKVASAARQAARERFGRNILVCCGGWIICRDSEREAREYFDYVIHQQGDRRSAEATLAEMMPNSHSIRGLERDGLVERLMAGFFGLPLIGTPQQIVERMQQAADAGIDGLALSWVDYHEGLRQYVDRIRPLMIAAGLRVS